MLTIAPTEIHLWLTHYDRIQDEALYWSYRDLLHDEERKQESRFYFQRDRIRYLVTRAMVRTVLSKYANVDPQEWMFAANGYGRPEIANRDFGLSDLTFNISHTHSLILLGVTRGRALGVDVENIQLRKAPIDIADRFFAPVEVAALAKVQVQQQHYRFFEYWTFKESYIKARGMGLSLPLDKFSFHYQGERGVRIEMDDELADSPQRWQLWQFSPSAEYLVAICAERGGGQETQVQLREIVPLRSDVTLVAAPLRISQ